MDGVTFIELNLKSTTMKKILSVLLLILTAQVSLAQGVKITSHVTAEEYKVMSDLEKRLSDYVDAAEASLKGIKLNGGNYAKYAASISINNKSGDKLNNNIAIAETDLPPAENAQSCTICGFGSARVCFKRILTILSNGQPLVITVTLVSGGDCVQLTWN